MIAEISAASLEYIRVSVAASASGSAVNPTSGTVTFAFLATSAAPVLADFKTGSWETDTSTEPDTYMARCLVGTGGAFVPTAGTTYNVYVKIVDNPETIIRRAGLLRVT